jgi:hypothetical protein
MLKHVPPEVMLRIKRYAYLLVLVVPAIAAYVAYKLTLGENLMFWAWFPVIFRLRHHPGHRLHHWQGPGQSG